MTKNDHLKIVFLAIIVLVTFCGCATERHIAPTISEPPRTGLKLNPPIIGSVFDGRATQKPKDAASRLKSDLSRIYGSSIEWENYFSKVLKGRIAIRIRIVTLGASFGSRLVSSTAFANAVSSAQTSASGTWGTIVGNVSAQQSVLAGSFSGEGWWNGAAWIDLEVQDHRGSEPINFILPIVAEHKESNMWGYLSGDKASHIAWQRVSIQLTRAMDAIFRAVRDKQP